MRSKKRPVSESIVITGIGCVTPLGVGVDATWRALLAGASVADKGLVPIQRDARPRVEQLATLALRDAIGIGEVGDAALFVGTSKGPADQWLADGGAGRYGLTTLADGIARDVGCRGDRHTSSAACASGLHALAAAVMRMRHDGLDRALVVAAESSLHGIWSATFKRLGVLAPPGQPGRPFDVDRAGFVIAEAAAALTLERRVPRAGDVVIESVRLAGDAHHLTGSDPAGVALRRLIADVSGGATIDFVHAHATATGVDAIELAAIDATLCASRPIVYSHKGATGHTLGASGLLATALTLRAMHESRVPPLATTRAAIDAGRCEFAIGGARRAIDTALVLAGGFGGALAAVRLRRIASDELASGR